MRTQTTTPWQATRPEWAADDFKVGDKFHAVHAPSRALQLGLYDAPPRVRLDDWELDNSISGGRVEVGVFPLRLATTTQRSDASDFLNDVAAELERTTPSDAVTEPVPPTLRVGESIILPGAMDSVVNERGTSSHLAWFLGSFGMAAVMSGGTLIVNSLQGRPELWDVGTPVFWVGQVMVVLAILIQMDASNAHPPDIVDWDEESSFDKAPNQGDPGRETLLGECPRRAA